GHGLLAHALLLLDDTSPCALVVDKAMPPSCVKLNAALADWWPRLAGRVEFVPRDIADVDLNADDIVVSSHACGRLSDVVLRRPAGAAPCCPVVTKRPPAARAVSGGGGTMPSRSIRWGRSGCGTAATESGRGRFPPTSRRRTVCCWASRDSVGKRADDVAPAF